MTNSIRTCLWFSDGRGREAAEFYCSLIPGSRMGRVFSGENSGDVGAATFSLIDFTLGGVPYQILDAGPYATSGRRSPASKRVRRTLLRAPVK